VRAEPYRVSVRAGESASATLHLRGFGPGIQHQRVEAHPPGGLVVEPPTVVADVPGDGRRAFPLTVRAAADAPAGVRIVPLDITLNGRRLGEWFDLIVEVTR